MAARKGKISELYDFAALEAQQAKAVGLVSDFVDVLNKVKPISVKLEGAEKTKDVVDGVKSLSNATQQVADVSSKAVNEMGKLVDMSKKVAVSYDEQTKLVNQLAGTLDNNIKLQTQYRIRLEEIKKELKLLSVETNDLAKNSAAYTNQVSKLVKEQTELKVATSELGFTIKAQVKESQAAVTSYDQQKQRLGLLRDAYRQLSDEEKNSDLGATLKANIDELRKSTEEQSESVGNFQHNVGNYATAFKGAFTVLETELNKVRAQLSSGAFKGAEFDALIKKEQALVAATGNVSKEFTSAAAAQKAYTNSAVQLGLTYGKNDATFKTFTKEVAVGSKEVDTLSKTIKTAGTEGNAFQGALSKIWGGLRQISYIIPGLGLAGLIGILITPLQAAAENVIDYISKLASGRDATREFEHQQKLMGEAIHESAGEFIKATTTVNELTINIDLAKKGFLDKDKVLKQYNESIGKTTGQVQTLDEAEKAIVKNGDAYIKMTLYKAAANIALEGAAKKAFEAEENRRKKEQEFQSIATNAAAASAGSSAPGFVPGQSTLDAGIKARADAAKKAKAAAIKEAEDAKNAQLDIAKKFQQDAASIAKDFRFDLFGGAENSKAKKERTDSNNQKEKDAKALFDAEVLRRQQYIDLFKQGADDEQASQDIRLMNLAQYVKLKNKLISDQADFEIRNGKHTADEIKLIRSKQDVDQIKVAEDAGKMLTKIDEDYLKSLKEHNVLVVDEHSALSKKLHDYAEKYLDDLDKKKKKEKETQDAIDKLHEEGAQKQKDLQNELSKEAISLGFDILSAHIENQKNALQDQEDLLDKQKAKEIEVVNASVASQQDKAAQIALIEARANAQHEALERRKRQLDEQKAKFDKAESIANIIQQTAVGILSVQKYGPPQSIILSGLIAAIGAAQLARILVTPIPHYKEGTEDHAGSLAVVGDGGVKEFIQTPEGDIYQTPDRSTLVDLPKHSKVFKDEFALLNAMNNHFQNSTMRIPGSPNENYQFQNMTHELGGKLDKVVKTIERIPQPIFEGRPSLKGWVHGGSETRYLNF